MNNSINRAQRAPALEPLESRRLMSLSVKLDYTYDTSGFFNTQSRRDVLQAAVNEVASHVKDHFSAIVPSGGNGWTVNIVNPSKNESIDLINPTVPADTVVIYVGAKALSGAAAITSTGGIVHKSGDSTWTTQTTVTRGRVVPADGFLATPSIGTITFLPNNPWYFGLSASGISPGQQDFYTVAGHEFGHMLGVGTSDAWFGRISDNQFVGPTAEAVYGGPVPTTNDGGGHLADGLRFDGQHAVMTHSPIGIGRRESFTRLDYALIDDMGYDVTLPPPVTGKYGSVTGYAYYDANKNGRRDAGEGSFGGAIYIDANNNNKFDANEVGVIPDADGKYTLASVPAGTFHLAQSDPYNQYAVFSPAGSYSVKIVADTTVTAPDFVNRISGTPTSHFGGSVYDDANGNGVADSGERGRGGITVYLDTNANGLLDSAEKRVVTGSAGVYVFSAIPNGYYRVRFVLPAGTVQTTSEINVSLSGSSAPNPTGLFTRTSGATLGGVAFDDANDDGLFDSNEQKLAGKTVYLDTNENGRLDPGEQRVVTDNAGTWKFINLPAGVYRVSEVMAANTEQTTLLSAVPLSETDTSLDQELGTFTLTGARVAGTVYADEDGDGSPAPFEPRLSGVTVFIDADNDNVLDANEARQVTGRGGAFKFLNVPNNSTNARLRALFPPGYNRSSPVDGYAVNLAIGAKNDDLYLGLSNKVPPAGVKASGTVFADANKNLKRDNGEAGLAGITVYVDADNDHVLDAGEVRTTTDGGGGFAFAGLTDTGAATRLRVIVPGGYGQTLPTQNYGYALNFNTGATNGGLLFGLYTQATPPPATGTIKGVAFNDVNVNGLFDGGDSLAAGKTIWLDLDDDGVKDANEPGVVSGGDGSFTFADLAAGTYHVRRSFPAGYLESSPARYITLTGGQTVTGVTIGSKASNR